jgi:hypothetical protein
MRKPKPKTKAARVTRKIKRIRLLKVEKLPVDTETNEPEKILVQAELLVEGVPDPPIEPLPTEPFEFYPCSSLREAVTAAEMVEVADPEATAKSGWRAWLRNLWD